MSADSLFLLCNYGVLPFWLLLAFAPGWNGTQRLVHSLLVPRVLGVVYAVAIAASFGSAPGDASFGSLAGVQAFFRDEWGALAGWVHYLVFDLFVGAWEVRDARRRGLSMRWVRVCLLFTLLLGPVGLALYLLVRAGLLREAGLQEAAAA